MSQLNRTRNPNPVRRLTFSVTSQSRVAVSSFLLCNRNIAAAVQIRMAPKPITKPRCTECRRKKIKAGPSGYDASALPAALTPFQCDYQRPSCSSCTVSKRDCVYQKSTIFITYVDPNSRPVQHTVNQAQQVVTKRRQFVLPGPVPGNAVHNRALSDGFLVRYYPEDDRWWRKTCSWSKPALEGMDFAPLKRASLAVGSAMMGLSTDVTRYKQYSLECYVKAMQDLRLCCDQGQRKDWFKIMLTILLLLTYDDIHPMEMDYAKPTGHSLGLVSILKLVGPTAFQKGNEHQAFLYSRLILVRYPT